MNKKEIANRRRKYKERKKERKKERRYQEFPSEKKAWLLALELLGAGNQELLFCAVQCSNLLLVLSCTAVLGFGPRRDSLSNSPDRSIGHQSPLFRDIS
jgi:hypothetical protein